MNLDQLQSRIKKKFGSISRFCKLAGIDRNDFINLIYTEKRYIESQEKYERASKERLQKLDQLWEKAKTLSPHDPNVATPKLINQIKAEIEKKGGVLTFCKENPEFKNFSTYQMIRIRPGKKRVISKKMLKIMEVLGIEC